VNDVATTATSLQIDGVYFVWTRNESNMERLVVVLGNLGSHVHETSVLAPSGIRAAGWEATSAVKATIAKQLLRLPHPWSLHSQAKCTLRRRSPRLRRPSAFHSGRRVAGGRQAQSCRRPRSFRNVACRLGKWEDRERQLETWILKFVRSNLAWRHLDPPGTRRLCAARRQGIAKRERDSSSRRICAASQKEMMFMIWGLWRLVCPLSTPSLYVLSSELRS